MTSARDWAYLDHASVSPLPARTADALRAWTTDLETQGSAQWPAWHQHVQEARRLGAELLHAQPEEVALVNSTTAGINLVAEGFPWRSGDNLVTLASEFPSNVYPWKNLSNQGVETRIVPAPRGRVSLADVAAACDARTRLLAVSWVEFLTGWRNDLAAWAELAHQRGAYLFVDAIQGLGVLPLDVRETPVDFLAADGHKWLLGPEGAGLFFTRSEHLDLLRPRGVGWNSMVRPYEFQRLDGTLKPTAARYEGGTYNTSGFVALRASLELHLRYALRDKEARLAHLIETAADQLARLGVELHRPLNAGLRSGILAFRWPGQDLAACRRFGWQQKVAFSVRGDCLRISPHVYNHEEDLDRFVQVLRDFRAGAAE